MAYESELRLPGDLGGRIVQAARLAMTLHCTMAWQKNLEGGAFMNVGRQPKTGRAESGAVTDDLPAGRAVEPSPWTLAGEDPAGSFH
ncbi:MAG TPA: hypothetical protein VL992_01825 [Tepidisphaeraceae bacterium]|nr:hypothetical protein [Tepidisphaeraceae bacterium]